MPKTIRIRFYCSQACMDWPLSTYKILNYGSVPATVSAIKDALVNYGPLVTTFSVYSDFMAITAEYTPTLAAAMKGGMRCLLLDMTTRTNASL